MTGLLLINKPSGITSFSAVSRIKRAAHEKRVGHTGTLDPMATGVLPVFLGRSTALSSFLLEADKTYVAEFLFGKTTDTLDITGNVLSESKVNITETEINAAIEHFSGEIEQIPPMYSALKRDGVPLYKLARRGENVEIEPRKVVIRDIKIVSPLKNNKIKLSITCSKGTYIRSLCRDFGEYLGCGAVLASLDRTATAGFEIADCVDLDKINEENITGYILPAEKAVMHLRSVSVTKPQAVRFTNGGELDLARLKLRDAEIGEKLRVKFGEQLLGIAEVAADSVKPKCVLMGSDSLE